MKLDILNKYFKVFIISELYANNGDVINIAFKTLLEFIQVVANYIKLQTHTDDTLIFHKMILNKRYN
jgi:sialic acid synthase SpsE